MFDRQKLREIAEQVYQDAKKLAVEKNMPKEAKEGYLTAIKMLDRIPKDQYEDYERRELGKYNYNIAMCYQDIYDDGNDGITEQQLAELAILYLKNANTIWTRIVDKTPEDLNRIKLCADAINTHTNLKYDEKKFQRFEDIMEMAVREMHGEENNVEEPHPSSPRF